MHPGPTRTTVPLRNIRGRTTNSPPGVCRVSSPSSKRTRTRSPSGRTDLTGDLRRGRVEHVDLILLGEVLLLLRLLVDDVHHQLLELGTEPLHHVGSELLLHDAEGRCPRLRVLGLVHRVPHDEEDIVVRIPGFVEPLQRAHEAQSALTNGQRLTADAFWAQLTGWDTYWTFSSVAHHASLHARCCCSSHSRSPREIHGTLVFHTRFKKNRSALLSSRA